MGDWDPQDFATLEGAGEIRIAGEREDGTLRSPVIIWSVVVDGELYVRSVRGRSGAWYRGTQARHRGTVAADGAASHDVTFEDVPADDPVQDRLDDAFRAKYGRGPSVDAITAPTALEATLRVTPR